MRIRSAYNEFHREAVTIKPEVPDDIWHAYNLVSVGDVIRAEATRKVDTETGTTGSTKIETETDRDCIYRRRTGKSKKVRTMLTIEVTAVSFDAQASVLRVTGKNIDQYNEYVAVGTYHSFNLNMHTVFTLGKREWDSVARARVKLARFAAKSADVAAVVMHEGRAHVCLITESRTIVKAKIHTSITRKRKGMCEQHEQSMNRFFNQIHHALLRHVNFRAVKCVILASPGFVREQFREYLFEQALKLDQRVLLENKSKFLLAHSSNGFKQALNEVLQDPGVVAMLSDTKASADVKALQDFYSMLNSDPNRAFYGIKHVETANELAAIKTLLVTDELFRSDDITQRRRYVKLVNSVKESHGKVYIFSSQHTSGEQLSQVSGVAAILRFPIHDPADEDDDDSSDED